MGKVVELKWGFVGRGQCDKGNKASLCVTLLLDGDSLEQGEGRAMM